MDKLDLIFSFSFEVPAKTTEEGAKKAKPTIEKCRNFASSLNILTLVDPLWAFDGIYPVRVVFNIKGDHNMVLGKVSALFAFAAVHELTLIQQVILPVSKEKL